MKKQYALAILRPWFSAIVLCAATQVQAVSLVTLDNRFTEGGYTVVDIYGNQISGGSGRGASISYFDESVGGGFTGADFPPVSSIFGTPIVNNSSGFGAASQVSDYQDNRFFGSGSATAEVKDPDNQLSSVLADGESIVDISFEITTPHTYTLTGNLTADALGRANLFFAGITASESLTPFSFSGYLASGSYFLQVESIAAVSGSERASASFDFELQLTEVSAVPLPAALWLFASGLAGLLSLARRSAR